MKPINFYEIDSKYSKNKKYILYSIPIFLIFSLIIFDIFNLSKEFESLQSNPKIYEARDVELLNEKNSALKEDYFSLEKIDELYNNMDFNKHMEREFLNTLNLIIDNTNENIFIIDINYTPSKVSLKGNSINQESIINLRNALNNGNSYNLEIKEIQFNDEYYSFELMNTGEVDD